mmetsp:Transcript_16273/g.46304  ORF Transcript_16273/g.46304 Transcript_16273/m.46304 type:complete len:279 (+) Transcript_16273:2488-3324(+)
MTTTVAASSPAAVPRGSGGKPCDAEFHGRCMLNMARSIRRGLPEPLPPSCSICSTRKRHSYCAKCVRRLMDRQPASLRDDGVCGICSAARAWAKGGSSIGLSYVTHVAQWLGGDITLTLIYRASSHGSTYGHLLHCVGDRRGLVFVIRKDKYVFGVYMSAGIQLPHDPKGYNDYSCYVYDFSLSGHFEKPTKMLDDRRLVYVAGREGTVGKLRIDGIGGCLCLGYGTADDMRSCRQSIPRQYVPEGYVGVRDDRGNAVFGGSEHFMADEIEVLHVAGQ